MYTFFKVCKQNKGDLWARFHLRTAVFSPQPEQKSSASALGLHANWIHFLLFLL